MVSYWVFVLALSILLYVLLDGFDLGIGILFGLTRDEAKRRGMMAAVAPVWDGNETWLVVNGVVLWGAFPIVYATLFSAFYLALLLMLAGLILRGVAFEFRYKAERMRPIWDLGFAGGSLVAAFIQGTMVGALVQGLPVANGHYIGGEFGWVSPFALICGVGLRRVISRWLERPYLFVFPAIGAVAALVLALSVRTRRDGLPFYMVSLIFVAAFGTLAISFWPYMIPFSITIAEAAAPHSSLAFMFWGAGLFVFPLMLIYTAISYSVFRGKIGSSESSY